MFVGGLGERESSGANLTDLGVALLGLRPAVDERAELGRSWRQTERAIDSLSVVILLPCGEESCLKSQSLISGISNFVCSANNYNRKMRVKT